MTKIITYIGVWLIKKAGWTTVYYILAGIYFASIVTAILAFFVALDFFITQIQTFLSLLSGSGLSGGGVLNKFFAVLSCIGFTSALNDVMPAILSGIAFLLARILIVQVNHFYKNAMGLVETIISRGI